MGSADDFCINPIDLVYQETGEYLEYKTHFHNSYEIIYIVEGKAEFKINDRMYTAYKDSIIFISNLEAHELKVVDYPYKRYFILLTPIFLQSVNSKPELISIFKHRPEHFRHVIQLNSNDRSNILQIIRQMHEEIIKKLEFDKTMLAAYLDILLVSLFRSNRQCFPLTVISNSINMIFEVQKHIEKHFMEDISLKEVAGLFFTDMFYLSHLFKKVTGYNFKEYVIRQRISKAKNSLFYTNFNITEVSTDAGFNNVNHFIQIFRKFEGITPYQYRKRFRTHE